MTTADTRIVVALFQAPAANWLAALRPNSRPQRWRWRAINAGNNRIMAESSESYTNEDDAMDAIDELFGNRSDVWLQRAGETDLLLRMPFNEA
ncbi:DUF1508 domain-containing protein [Mycobacterium sp. 1465703.0]|uniref:DUF1508 domain-containing protein n=1 Tax=Mycobacterium sp. 1465703.0 TaxID=1834078 RepID=UPI0007FC4732|nr:DUF1508 domain-containing protein [Mycobacterium sp. 1465703.0]OBI95578.1 hypothetical protein A5625_08165 [Mycobacterium sp. 1465703.0]